MPEIKKTHDLYIVKHNDGKTIRLAKFMDILYKIKQEDRVEVELVNLTKEEVNNKYWQKNCIIWWSPSSSYWYEATQDDGRAREEYKQVVEQIETFPDIDPEAPNSCGTLVKTFGLGEQFLVVDGNARSLVC